MDNFLSLNILPPRNCLNCPLYIGNTATSTANVLENTLLRYLTRHDLSLFPIFIISYNLFYEILFVYLEI